MAEAYITPTTAATWIPEVWSGELIVARESSLMMANLVKRFDADVVRFGDTIHVPLVSNLTAGNISTSDGSLDATAPTESEVQILIDKWKCCVINVLDISAAQSKYGFVEEYSGKIGYALGVIVEQDLLALAAGLSVNKGTFNTNTITDQILRDSVQALDDARVPFSDRHLVVKPVIKNAILGIDKFTRADSVAYGKGESPIVRGNFGEIYGVMTHVTPEVYKTGNNTSNMMFHRDAFALAVQKNIKMEQFARTSFTQRMGASELYGVKELRDDHGVEIRS